jgi:hypothetical protein
MYPLNVQHQHTALVIASSAYLPSWSSPQACIAVSVMQGRQFLGIASMTVR